MPREMFLLTSFLTNYCTILCCCSHLVTLLFIQLVTVSIFDSYNILYLRFGLIIGFCATTEQLSFVALLCYRLEYFKDQQSTLFLVAAIQTFLVKFALLISSLVYYAIEVRRDGLSQSRWDEAWMYFFIPLLLSLFIAQNYSSWILYQLSMKLRPTDLEKLQNTLRDLEKEMGDVDQTQNVDETTTTNRDADVGEEEQPRALDRSGRGQRRSGISRSSSTRSSIFLGVGDSIEEFRDSKFGL
jgi:hypothetical protein